MELAKRAQFHAPRRHFSRKAVCGILFRLFIASHLIYIWADANLPADYHAAGKPAALIR